MIIQITMPLQGTWYVQEKRGDKVDSVRPLPLPFAVSYRSTQVSLDIDGGAGIYEIEIDDASLTPALRAQIMAFAKQPVAEKRAAFTASRGNGIGTFNIRERSI